MKTELNAPCDSRSSPAIATRAIGLASAATTSLRTIQAGVETVVQVYRDMKRGPSAFRKVYPELFLIQVQSQRIFQSPGQLSKSGEFLIAIKRVVRNRCRVYISRASGN
jgi:hypothetical protein